MVVRDAEGVALAAGGVVWRPGRRHGARDAIEVAGASHRPRLRRLELPEGQARADRRRRAACAVREVLEETGLTAVPGRELPSTTYRDAKRRPKGCATG